MITPAIQQAIQLNKHPDEMAWLCFTESELPEGISDLLRLCTSKNKLKGYADILKLDSECLTDSLINFIEKVMLVEGNSNEKILGTDKFSSEETKKLHYQFLMRIYHPDINASPKASKYSTMITQAYQVLKQKNKDAQDSASINVSDCRMPPKSYYQATHKSQTQISNTRSAIAILSAIFIVTIVALVGHLYDPANPELIAISTNIEIPASVEQNVQNEFRVAALTPSNNPDITDTQLQYLLKNLETAYEEGIVSLIKPILANTPEIKGQTEKELSDKLETLFEITTERKMLLFDFEWKDVGGQLEGTGKFISRYHLVGEEKWLSREGIATVTTQKTGNQLKITQLELENNAIDH